MKMNKTTYALPLIAGSLFMSACFGTAKKSDKYESVNCGPGWNYQIEKVAVDSVRRALHLRGSYLLDEDLSVQTSTEPVSGSEDRIKKRLERLVVIDANRDNLITRKEAKVYEQGQMKLFQEELEKQDKADSKTLLQNFRGK